MVGTTGIEPVTPSMSMNGASPYPFDFIELRALELAGTFTKKRAFRESVVKAYFAK